MANIKIENLTFGYDNQEKLLFNQANLNVDTSWKLGLIGRNGRGKTTLLKILQDKLHYAGKITHQLTFVYFPQKVIDKSQLTYYVLKEIVDFEDWKLERELNLLNLSPDILWRAFDLLSGGEQTKVLLSLLFLDEQNFPLIDEPTNHLDILGRKQVADYLRRKKQGFIVVSHDRAFVDEVSDHILSIERGGLVLYQGNFSTYEEQKKRRDEFELAQNEKLKGSISRLKKTAFEKKQWSDKIEKSKYNDPKVKGTASSGIADRGFIGAKAAKMMKRSKNIERRMDEQIEEKEGLLKNLEKIDPLSMNYQATHHKLLMKVEELTLSFDEKALFQPVSFEVRSGRIVAIAGANGSGKSSMVKFLLDKFVGKANGNYTHSNHLNISYVRQNYADNKGTLSEFAQQNGLDFSEFLNNLRKLGMERVVFQNRIENMSMGQRKKVELAKSLSQPAELYIWDEPLNYLDVFNHEQLEELILNVKPAMILIEHDQHFLEKIADEVIELS
ncbi:MAG: Lsa family ABC-F type ribosomal protection protein [Streptococcaceae bacterium]|jgi:lincosamide and streptogramin A transport system ATP-binding/permease protein|nr:Lsa family ABC-F type ribosomal protection protein [Streptococcaceae bacterium]